MKNIFLENSYTKCGGETIPRPFSEKTKLSISKDIETKLRLLAFTSHKAFSKNKKWSGTGLPALLSIFKEKFYIFY